MTHGGTALAHGEYSAAPPIGIDAVDTLTKSAAQLYTAIRNDIVSGRLGAHERLIIADLAKRHGSSTTPVREVLQILRGEGLVVFTRHCGARVRAIDHDFVRNIYEIGLLIEPALTRWFVGMATESDIAGLERIQDDIEANNFADPSRHSDLDTRFHTLIYERHYNQHAAELWWRHREVLRAVARRYKFTLARQAQIIRDHRDLIALIRAGDAEKAAALVARHVEGSGLHILEQMRAMPAARAMTVAVYEPA